MLYYDIKLKIMGILINTTINWYRYVILCAENKFYIGITPYLDDRWKESK